MKKVILSLLTAFSALTVSQVALAECDIYISACPRFPAYQGRLFRDSDPVALVNPNRCLQRAAEYRAWCAGSPTSTVTAYFITRGVYSVAQTVQGNSKVRYATDIIGNRWIVLD